MKHQKGDQGRQGARPTADPGQGTAPARPDPWAWTTGRLVWTCPKCGAAWLASDLHPRCFVCGTKESPS